MVNGQAYALEGEAGKGAGLGWAGRWAGSASGSPAGCGCATVWRACAARSTQCVPVFGRGWVGVGVGVGVGGGGDGGGGVRFVLCFVGWLVGGWVSGRRTADGGRRGGQKTEDGGCMEVGGSLFVCLFVVYSFLLFIREELPTSEFRRIFFTLTASSIAVLFFTDTPNQHITPYPFTRPTTQTRPLPKAKKACVRAKSSQMPIQPHKQSPSVISAAYALLCNPRNSNGGDTRHVSVIGHWTALR
ncbi:uncharacterized protein K452DRAFT_343429 [Aplosporella prunicola CBS 121167]|uniref:Uncharacterized protein n=1 Tax=Aplosporella prunicola CBS 121167 TaxID=1176127 RepID=A0A6A6BNW1_9PEZI|nr:uncharacterized protein K452DRAFT_343429 [Aplosporella prunicola CBS 121167]KAF2144924.1 hypothetical protein K452DRAFT_343429 [Aplosporella prunicola CBS 121167]